MFGRRRTPELALVPSGPKSVSFQAPEPSAPASGSPAPIRSNDFYELKKQAFNALLEIVDVARLAELSPERARTEIRSILADVIEAKKVALSTAEEEDLLDDICNDVLGYGPLEPLLARDDIADIMVNGCERYLH